MVHTYMYVNLQVISIYFIQYLELVVTYSLNTIRYSFIFYHTSQISIVNYDLSMFPSLFNIHIHIVFI